mmetsp:Transcript_3496/g.13985  ORF Transcript_3496/g.13985 Transcript_3496/m.13985 type:complete len:203 (-) Transcript_3496:1032-1640(-)
MRASRRIHPHRRGSSRRPDRTRARQARGRQQPPDAPPRPAPGGPRRRRLPHERRDRAAHHRGAQPGEGHRVQAAGPGAGLSQDPGARGEGLLERRRRHRRVRRGPRPGEHPQLLRRSQRGPRGASVVLDQAERQVRHKVLLAGERRGGVHLQRRERHRHLLPRGSRQVEVPEGAGRARGGAQHREVRQGVVRIVNLCRLQIT